MDDVENTNSSGLFSFLYEVTPLNPLIQPVNDDEVFPVYVIISSLIFKIPYVSGNPIVPVGDLVRSTFIVVSLKSASDPRITELTKLVFSFNLIYLSIF